MEKNDEGFCQASRHVGITFQKNISHANSLVVGRKCSFDYPFAIVK